MEIKNISKEEGAFESEPCLLVENMISEDCRKVLAVLMSLEYVQNSLTDRMVDGSDELYGSATLCVINQMLLNKVKQIVKEPKLYPTYGFYRKYYKGQALYKHTDRPECQLTVSICLSESDDSEWPLYVADTKNNITYKGHTKPGDAIIYTGEFLPHWRDECPKDWCKQFFLHYSTDSRLKFDPNSDSYKDKLIVRHLIESYLEQD